MNNPYPETVKLGAGGTIKNNIHKLWQEGYDAKEKEAQDLYEALKAMYGNWIVRPDDEINTLIYKMAGQAIAEVGKC